MTWILIGLGMFLIWVFAGYRAGNVLLRRLVPDTIGPGLELEADPARGSRGLFKLRPGEPAAAQERRTARAAARRRERR